MVRVAPIVLSTFVFSFYFNGVGHDLPAQVFRAVGVGYALCFPMLFSIVSVR